MSKRILSLLALAAMNPCALAQVNGTATWLWDVTTENGDAVVEPGETATITLSVDMTPDVNYPGGPVLGLAGAIFDVLGGLNASEGTIVGWQILNDLDVAIGDQTTTDGVSLFGVTAINGLELFTPQDPIEVIEFYWAPEPIGSFGVQYATDTNILTVWQGSQGNEVAVPWSVVEAEIAFQVVPAPHTLMLAMLACVPLLARRRSRTGAPATFRKHRELWRPVHCPNRLLRATVAVGLATAVAPSTANAQDGQVALIAGHAFEGPTQTQDQVFIALPPDCSIAVSEGTVTAIANEIITAYDRTSNPPFDVTEAYFDDFFGSGYDPQVVWDAIESQFVAAAISGGMEVVYTKTASPLPFGTAGVGTSAWLTSVASAFDSSYEACSESPCADGDETDENIRIDRPSVGYDHLAWYVSAPTVTNFGSDRLNNFFYIIEKEDTNNNTPIRLVYSDDFISNSATQLCCFLADGIAGAQGREGAYAAIHDTSAGNPPAAYFVGAAAQVPIGSSCPTDNFKALRLFAIVNPLDDVNRELRFYNLVVSCFDPDLVNVPTGDDSGSTGGGDGRITGAFWHHLDEDLLYVVHSVNHPIMINGTSHNQKVIRWYIIETNGWPGGASNPTLRDSGEINAGTTFDAEDHEFPVHLICPAITANENGDVAIVACKTSVTDPPTIVATGRFEFSDPGEMFDLYDVKPSTSTELPNPNRWGDYSGIAPDPDGSTFWGFGEYMRTISGNGRWATWIFHFELDPLP